MLRNFFKIKRPNTCPIPEESRVMFEQSFLALARYFGLGSTWNRRVLLPTATDFPIQYDGSEESVN